MHWKASTRRADIVPQGRSRRDGSSLWDWSPKEDEFIVDAAVSTKGKALLHIIVDSNVDGIRGVGSMRGVTLNLDK